MSKMVTIPTYTRPYWECFINGVHHRYTAGSTQEVPDEVAALIDHLMKQQPKEPVKAEYADYDMVIFCSTTIYSGVTASSFLVVSGSADAVLAKLERGLMPRVRVSGQHKVGNEYYFDDSIAYRVDFAGDYIGIYGIANVGRWNMNVHKDSNIVTYAKVTKWESDDQT